MSISSLVSPAVLVVEFYKLCYKSFVAIRSPCILDEFLSAVAFRASSLSRLR